MKFLSAILGLGMLLPLIVCAQDSADKGKRSLSSIATVLVRGEHSTRIPKGAILHIPTRLSDRVSSSLQGEYLSWNDFLRKNRSWIYLQEVTMKQAAGKEPIKQQVVKSWKTFDKMVIAVNHGDPVSVKPKAYQLAEAEE
mgnify:FL=1